MTMTSPTLTPNLSENLEQSSGEPNQRIYAVGDIHGCIVELQKLRRMIETDAETFPTKRKVIIYLGDYVDRGLDSRAVIEALTNEPLPGFESVHLKGNHEDTLVRFLDDGAMAPLWLAYGGAATLLSYGVQPPRDASNRREVKRAQQELAEALPPSHLTFLRGLSISREIGDYFFVHAGVRPGVPLELQAAEEMIWIRNEFLESDSDFGKIIVHGHNITAAPDMRTNRIGIDTGAFATGHLTCLVIDGVKRLFFNT